MATLYDNKHEYLKNLGEGGLGKVLLAKEKVFKRLVAIKQLKNKDRQNQEDIIHEIEVASKFENQNIVAYYHHFWQDAVLNPYSANETDFTPGHVSAATRKDLENLITPKLSDMLTEAQKKDKVKNLLQSMKREGRISLIQRIWKKI